MPKPWARSAMLSADTDQVDAGGLGVAVVLGDEDRRQVPHGSTAQQEPQPTGEDEDWRAVSTRELVDRPE